MSYFNAKYVPSYLFILIGFFCIYQSYFSESIALFFMGITLLLLGIFSLMAISVIELFRKDKEFNLEHFKKEGFETIVCTECDTENIIVDKFCRNCGKSLGDENNEEI